MTVEIEGLHDFLGAAPAEAEAPPQPAEPAPAAEPAPQKPALSLAALADRIEQRVYEQLAAHRDAATAPGHVRAATGLGAPGFPLDVSGDQLKALTHFIVVVALRELASAEVI